MQKYILTLLLISNLSIAMTEQEAADKNLLTWLREQYDSIETLRTLLEAGANANMADSYLWTPLMRAAHMNNHEMVRILIKAGVDVDKMHGFYALTYGAFHNNLGLTHILIEEGGADRLKKDIDGETAIDTARRRGNTAVLALLSEPIKIA